MRWEGLLYRRGVVQRHARALGRFHPSHGSRVVMGCASGSRSALARSVVDRGLTEQEVQLADALLVRTRRLADDAASKGVKLMIDAEARRGRWQTWR